MTTIEQLIQNHKARMNKQFRKEQIAKKKAITKLKQLLPEDIEI